MAYRVHTVIEDGKVRVRPDAGQGLDPTMNCQFPRALRTAANLHFIVDDLVLAGGRKAPFYRAVGRPRLVLEPVADVPTYKMPKVPPRPTAPPRPAATPPKTPKGPQAPPVSLKDPTERVLDFFDDDD